MDLLLLLKKYFILFLGEMTCTFIFGFAVYASKIGSVQIESELLSVTIGLNIGFVSIALIYSFKTICPAHFNPAITFAAMFFLKIPIIDGLIAILAQLCGVMVGAGVVLGCFPQDRFVKLDIIRSKEAFNGVSNGRLICTELFLAGILVFVNFAMRINAFKETELDEKEVEKKGRKPADENCVAPLTIGITYGFLSFCGLSSSGSVFNPALVWAPALFIPDWRFTWQYWIGEFAGGIAGGGLQVFLLNRGLFSNILV